MGILRTIDFLECSSWLKLNLNDDDEEYVFLFTNSALNYFDCNKYFLSSQIYRNSWKYQKCIVDLIEQLSVHSIWNL